MRATVIGTTKVLIWLRIPDLSRKILTLDRRLFPDAAKGDTLEVTVESDIESSDFGWTALVLPTKKG